MSGNTNSSLSDELQFVIDFYNKNPEIRDKLVRLFGKNFADYDIIKCISENRQLFDDYRDEFFDKCCDIYKAIAINNANTDSAVIYFTELKLYAVVRLTNLGGIMKIMKSNNKINISKIILENHQQRLSFMCSDISELAVSKLHKYIREYLSSDISVLHTRDKLQITVDSVVYDSYNDAIGKFAYLQSRIRIHDEQLAQNISTMPIFIAQPYVYLHVAI